MPMPRFGFRLIAALLVVGVLAAGCESADVPVLDPAETAPSPTYLGEAENVAWVAAEPTASMFLTQAELPWTDVVDISNNEGRPYLHGFCADALPSDHVITEYEEQPVAEPVGWGSDEQGGWISVVQQVVAYELPIGATAVDEIRGLVSSCGDYQIAYLTKAPVRNALVTYSSCGLVDLGLAIPDGDVVSYCEVGYQEDDEFHTIHTYIGVDRYLLVVRVSLWDKDETVRYAGEFTATVLQRFEEDLRGKA
ncbi:MAG TPA: hypothetical protein VGF17_00180 [Phytomonospora sp.]